MDWIISHFLTALVISFSAMLIAWLIYLLTRTPAIVDVFWGIGIAATPITLYLLHGKSTRQFWEGVITALVVLWMLRLSGFLLSTRVIKKHTDKRYQALSDGWKKNLSIKFLGNFMFQATLQTFFSFAFLFYSVPESIKSASPPPPTELMVIPVALFFIGLIGETLADLQLYNFKKTSQGKEVCQVGLWKLSRHPNYFFEFVVWLSLSLMSFTLLSSQGLMVTAFTGLIAPMILLGIFLGITLPWTERLAVKSRGELYQNYQDRVSKFFPWFPKS